MVVIRGNEVRLGHRPHRRIEWGPLTQSSKARPMTRRLSSTSNGLMRGCQRFGQRIVLSLVKLVDKYPRHTDHADD